MTPKEAASAYPELLADLYAMTAEELIEADDLLNRWQWHARLKRHQPEGWDGMSMADMHGTPVMRAAASLLNHMVSDWQRSRYHFAVNLDRTPEQHMMYWFRNDEWRAEMRRRLESQQSGTVVIEIPQ